MTKCLSREACGAAPTFQSSEEGGGRLGGHRVEEQFVGGADEEFQAQHGGAQRRRRRESLGGAQVGLQAPEGLHFLKQFPRD